MNAADLKRREKGEDRGWGKAAVPIDAFKLIQMTLFDVPRRKRRCRRFARNAAKLRGGRLLLAGGLIFDHEHRILLLHRATPNLQQWETPGGKVDRGESPEEAALREVKEELGVVTRVIGDLGAHDVDTKGLSFRYALFALNVVEGTPCVIETQTFDQLRYFSEGDLIRHNLKLSPNAMNLLRLRMAGRLSLEPRNPALPKETESPRTLSMF